MLAAYRGNIRNISFHKIHIRPLRGGRPRTIVRVASRDIRAGAEKGGRWTVFGVTQSGFFCYGRADFLLRGSGLCTNPRNKSGWHGRFDGVFVTGRLRVET